MDQSGNSKVKQFLGKGQRAIVPCVIGITEETRRAKQGTPRRLAGRQEYFETCLPETLSFYEAALDMVQDAGHEIYWGTKGFSMRFEGEERKISFAYGYPPNIFDFYFGYFKYSRMSPEQVAALRQELLSFGILVERGQNTLRAEIEPKISGTLLKALTTMMHRIPG